MICKSRPFQWCIKCGFIWNFYNLYTFISQLIVLRTLCFHIFPFQIKQFSQNPITCRDYKFSDKPTFDTSLERSWLGNHRFYLSSWSGTIRWNFTISNLKACSTWIILYYAKRSRVSCERLSKVRLVEPNNIISDRREAKGMAILSDTLVRSRQASYWCFRNIV